ELMSYGRKNYASLMKPFAYPESLSSEARQDRAKVRLPIAISTISSLSNGDLSYVLWRDDSMPYVSRELWRDISMQ
ncbi:MAG: hypothetical protein AB7P69_09655, partial [Candidatus Binatia bacterium]